MSTRCARLLAIPALLALLALSGVAGARARAARGRLAGPEVSPSDFAGLVVASGFRPIAVDALWVRAEDLSQERRYYELLSLYEMITALDPHFEGAWVYNSFNLAFRLGALEDTPQKRWRWTREALLHAMKGMEKNPESDEIAFTIAWIYYHRVPQDDYHIARVLEDAKLNPRGEPVIELARQWAERGYKTKPHVIYIDWILEFIYRDYGNHSDDPEVKLQYLRKRLGIWRYVRDNKPFAARAAAKRISELEEAIAAISRSH